MNELPHYLGLDFSAAGPWVLVGFLAGLFLSWLWRALRGSRLDAKAQAKIQEIETLLDASRSEHQADVARLLGDARNFEQALADAERRAASHAAGVSKLTADLDRLSKAELTARNELLSVDGQMAKLKSSLQWAETQARNAAQEREALQQQLNAFLGDRQKIAADLATAKTAAELKDAEIARLINQVQWHESRAAALEQEKLGLTSNLSALGTKDEEIARLAGALSAAQGEGRPPDRRCHGRAGGTFTHARRTGLRADDVGQSAIDGQRRRGCAGLAAEQIRSGLEGSYLHAQPCLLAGKRDRQVAQGDYRIRNGCRGQSRHLGSAVAAVRHFEEQGRKPNAHLGRRSGWRPNWRQGRPAGGKFAFLHRHGKATPKAVRKAYKLKQRAAAGDTTGTGTSSRAKRINGYGHPLMVLGKPAATQPRSSEDIAKLKAQLAALSEDASRYRRLKDAVHHANKIADEQV